MSALSLNLAARGGLAGLLLAGDPAAATPEDFYTRKGGDPSFADVMESGDLPRGRNSRHGVEGSKVRVEHELLRSGPNADRSIPEEIRIHTLGNSSIPRAEFGNWSRWYQEDGNTQIFRLFDGETNVRNSRPFAARIEAFSNVAWEEGEWHEWVGTYTILKPHRMIIFQARNQVNDWSVQLNMDHEGDVILNRRVGEDEVIAEDMVGRPFHVRVRDNGRDYEVFLDGRKVGDGSYARPKGKTRFRWGLYRGGRPMTRDTMLLVTGAAVDPSDYEWTGERVAVGGSEEPENPEEELPEGLPIRERVWRNADGRTLRAAGVYDPRDDSLKLRIGGEWIDYPLEGLSERDRKALLKAKDFRPER